MKTQFVQCITHLLYNNLFSYVFLIEDSSFFRTADEDSNVPQFNRNIGVASAEKVEKERGLCFFSFW